MELNWSHQRFFWLTEKKETFQKMAQPTSHVDSQSGLINQGTDYAYSLS